METMTDVIAGRFALEDPIARGGSGVIWRAFDRRTGTECAAKVLRRRDAGDLLRFVREQSIRVVGPHVLAPYAWAAEDDAVVIASKLVSGGPLSTLLGDYGPLAEGTAAVVLDQLLEALEHVHGAGLVHRDVKTANVLLEPTGSGRMDILLTDFGLAVGLKDPRLTETGAVFGTPGYLAPEVSRGLSGPHQGQDLYAAGQLAEALLSGVEPDLAGRREGAEVRDPALRAVLGALREPDPALRPPSATAARALLAAAGRDDQPRTRDGEPVEVLEQLASNGHPPGRTTDLGDVPAAPPETRVISGPFVEGGRIVDAGTGAGRAARPWSPSTGGVRRRAALLWTGVGVLLLAAGAIGAVELYGNVAQQPAPHPGQTASTPAVPPSGMANPGCGWQEEGNATTINGVRMVCTRQGGSYLWLGPDGHP